MNLLLDTCILSELRMPEGSIAVKSFIASLPERSLFLSVITLGEVAKGIALLANGRKKQALGLWQISLSNEFEDRILSLDQETAGIWRGFSASGLKKGLTIPTADG